MYIEHAPYRKYIIFYIYCISLLKSFDSFAEEQTKF